MEMLTYKCPVCGFVYQVPAYWSDFSAEEKYEMMHINMSTQSECEASHLELVKLPLV